MSVTLINAQCRLAARPVGLPKPADWDFVQEEAPAPQDGEFRVAVEYLSVDPAMRSWMNAGRSYVAPVEIGELMRAAGIGRVIDSRHPDFKVGEHVYGVFGVQRYAVSDGKGVTRVDTTLAPAPVHLGVLGISGLTAYFGLLDVGRPEPGQTVVVSGAAGSVGSVVGQIARIKGCRAIGIAGGEDKCRWLTDELGFDAAIDYKSENVGKALRQHCPKGIDVFFDNVGGAVLNEVLARINLNTRIVLCGSISKSDAATPQPGPANYSNLVARRARMEGFTALDYPARVPEAFEALASWQRAGSLVHKEDVAYGLENAPKALLRLFAGENFGKQLVKVADAAG
jgi:NADPH-dependent curcumin reductase